MEQLSRRLHQCPSDLANQRGASLSAGNQVNVPTSRYKCVASLSSTDAAYIAGLVDGEGTVTLSRRHAHDRRQLVVSIANTELQLLQFVLRSVGAGKITSKRIARTYQIFCVRGGLY
jgi:hypothetical protein